jgi:hypothetical protein
MFLLWDFDLIIFCRFSWLEQCSSFAAKEKGELNNSRNYPGVRRAKTTVVHANEFGSLESFPDGWLQRSKTIIHFFVLACFSF